MVVPPMTAIPSPKISGVSFTSCSVRPSLLSSTRIAEWP
jgi:hypothetical protein